MDDDLYKKDERRRWAVSRKSGDGKWVHLIERTPLFDEDDAVTALRMLRITYTQSVLNHHFPQNAQGKRCPTFEVMMMFLALDPTHPRHTKSKDAIGV